MYIPILRHIFRQIVGLCKKYIKALKAEFFNQRQDFQIEGLILSYHINPNWFDITTTFLDVDLFLSGGILAILKCRKLNFKHLKNGHPNMPICGNNLEGSCLGKSPAILNCQAFALLLSNYTCEQILSHMKAVLSIQKGHQHLNTH